MPILDELARILQYWIVDPIHPCIEVYILNLDKYKLKQIYFKDDVMDVEFFDGLIIDL